MSWPSNDTGLSLAGVLKWICIIVGGVFLFQAYQGIFEQKGMAGVRGTGRAISGQEAVAAGWSSAGYATLSLILAWALWFFWQRNED